MSLAQIIGRATTGVLAILLAMPNAVGGAETKVTPVAGTPATRTETGAHDALGRTRTTIGLVRGHSGFMVVSGLTK